MHVCRLFVTDPSFRPTKRAPFPGPLDQPLILRLEVVANGDGGLVALILGVGDRDGDLVLRADVVGELVDEGVDAGGATVLGPDDAAFETGDDFVQGATEGEAVGVVRGDGDGGIDASGDILEQVANGDAVSTDGVEASASFNSTTPSRY